MTVRLSVIIPALNEADRIEATLRSVGCAAHATATHEVIVVDGGSEDATVARVAACATVVASAPGRARQMNAGAAHATGDVLLFLHADTCLPPGGLAAIRTVLAEPDVEAGAFRLRFDRETALLRFYARCSYVDWSLLCFGDRGLFVRRTVFDALGGFPEVPIFEDLELVRRLAARGGFRFLDEAVVTAARRFERYGLVRQQLRNLYLWTRYVLGADPHRLARLYRYDRRPG